MKKLFSITLRSLLLTVLSLCAFSLNAQDIYLSISGKNVSFKSGDNLHRHEIWVKPEADAPDGILQVYDAGLGGAVDIITTTQVTTTTYSLFPFDSVYDYENGNLQRRGDSTAISSDTRLVTRDEERFKNRWVTLSKISSADKNGFLVRVEADEGDDVNNFDLRIVNSAGEVLSGSSWKIISVDLSIGLYRSSTDNFFQLKPYKPGPGSPDLVSAGEEDSEVSKIDGFGEIYPRAGSAIPETKFGLQNTWGLHIQGSDETINNLTVRGHDQPVLWLFEPIYTEAPEKPNLSVNELATRRCTDKAFELQSNTLTLPGLRQAQWILNNQAVATGTEPVISFPGRGAASVHVLIPNAISYFPKYWAYEKEVFVNTPPVARLESPKEIVSPGEQITLSAKKSYDLEGQLVSFSWFVNGTLRGSGSEFTFSNTISGQYIVSVRVSDGGVLPNCSNSQKQIRIRVNTQPYAEMEYVPIFGTGDQVQFSAVNQTDADNDVLYYEWDGMGVIENKYASSATIAHYTPGTYEVSLTVDDSSKATNSSYTIKQQYEVNAAPIVQFNAPSNVAPGDSILLDGTASADSNQSELLFQWLLNGNEIAKSRSTTISLEEPGDYEVKLVVDDNQGVSNSRQELAKNLHVNASPEPVITAPRIISTSTVSLTAGNSLDTESGISSYTWDFGDGNSASGADVEHTYQKSGTYVITLTVDDGEGLNNSVQETEHVLVVNKFPESNFEAPEVVAPNQSFTVDGTLSFDEDGMITDYEWYAAGIPAARGPSPSLMLSEPGEHTLSLRVKDNSGFDIAEGLSSKKIRVNKSPVPRWTTVPERLVPGEEILFDAGNSYDPDGTIEKYLWVFDDGTELEGQQVRRKFDESGHRRFTLTVTDNDRLSNSSSTVEGVKNVNHQPYIITEPVVRSNSLDVSLDASQSYDLDNNPLHYTWTMPDGSKRNEARFSWKAPEPGVHIIGLSIDDGLGLSNSVNQETIRVLVNRPVKAVVDSVIASCTGQTVLFNSSRSYDPDGDAFRVNWDFGNGDTSEEANPSYVYEKPGVYDARLSMNDGFSGEETVAKIPVIIEGSPIAKMNIADTTICVNSAIEFDGAASTDPSGSLPSFAWDLGDGSSETGPKVRHVFTEPGEYTVSLTVEGSGSGRCSNVSQVTGRVRVIEGPEASFELPEWVAPGEEVALDASESHAEGGFKKVEWLIENADTTYTAEGINTSHTFKEPGEFFVTLNLETNTTTACNTVSLTRTIKVNDAPKMNWTLPEYAAAGSDVKLDAIASHDTDGFIQQYKWFYDDSLISTNAAEIIKAVETGTHTVTLEITDNSLASNKTSYAEKSFFANSAPKPEISAPAHFYLNEEVIISGLSERDLDGDELTSSWFIDGKPVNEPIFTPTELKTYRVTLVQDDGRGLSNSTDSAVVEITPAELPEIEPVYPEVISEGASLSINDLQLPDDWSFMIGNEYRNQWTARTAGSDSLVLAWSHEGKILHTTSFQVEIAGKLTFTSAAESRTLEWNPSNPTTILAAPSVNRDLAKVSYTWMQNGQVVGTGKHLEVSLSEGTNTFTVEVRDNEVARSSPIRTEITVKTL